jgi:hypothetical protein
MAWSRAFGGLAVVLMILTSAATGDARAGRGTTLQGIVESGGSGLEGYEVSLYARFLGRFGRARVVGRATTGPSGEFRISYDLPHWLPRSWRPLLFVRAESGSAMLASALGQAPVTGPVVVNERTTVATGFAYAQFVNETGIDGNRYGMLNAAHMAANLAHPETGTVAAVLRLPPNGPETEALPTFNSLANIVAACIADERSGCAALFEATTLPGGTPPANLLQAVANIARYPWLNVGALFDLSFEQPLYTPALAEDQPPDAWTLFLRFTGKFSNVKDEHSLMNGPGAIAIDRKGFLWVNDNYVPQPPHVPACDGKRLIKFYPWGEPFPGTPYFGGGLSGAGFGISIGADGLIWVGNFGFAAPVGCDPPPADSVSLFLPNGRPLSPRMGFRAGPISWPQATVPDRRGNIWIANCAADSVTVYPDGWPERAFETVIQPPTPGATKMKPFGLAIDDLGRAWVAGSRNSTLGVVGPDGDLLAVVPSANADGVPQLRRPMGVASDSRGNIWVSNSDFLDVPCPPEPPEFGSGKDPSVALFRRQPGGPALSGTTFTGGGITIPWGNAVDGNDTVWVANFDLPFSIVPGAENPIVTNRVSHFCGVDTSKCPPTKQTVGQAISPDVTGYASRALARNTGVSIDPSGNVWLANNWTLDIEVINPGGNSIAVLIGAAAPIKTPLIGPPQSFDRRPHRWRRPRY